MNPSSSRDKQKNTQTKTRKAEILEVQQRGHPLCPPAGSGPTATSSCIAPGYSTSGLHGIYGI